MTKHAAIIGGGIAGPVAAMALQRAGFTPTIHEAYDRTAEGVGAFLTLAPNGVSALAALGVDAGEVGFPTPKMHLYLGEDRFLKEMAMQGEHGRAITLNRVDLYVLLRDEAQRRGIEVRYGQRLVGAEGGAGSVRARFQDGSTTTADLLIGADGLRSTVRRVIDPGAPEARYVPLLNTGGYARGVDLGTEVGVVKMVFGRRAFLGAVTAPDGTVWWFANVPQKRELSREELAAVSPEQWRGRLVELFAEDGDLARGLIEGSPELMAPWSTYDFPTVPVWHRDRMLIIGDAAHATSPAAGQGASMALEDAVELGRCLRDLPVDRAFAAYEAARRGRVERVVKQGKRNGDAKGIGAVGRVLLPLVFRFMPDPDLRWLYDRQAVWDEPVRA
ncbi:FAD-dependent oxidoreductase [Actinokineospora bangkokensis]|uniref:FAD-dependent oxidoreductase n=1 Tax=Actinokineospora bangkokensis TaxID=1193682 RepID=A0A1Q9LFN0_9PSEU|nr:NAD(P)/FAD-dependent oxidoreductase [Actinokineospora bangkokensis]OLR90841.1 FAD-dependent oxidoreductase [Actinokineospora bangkokensis]